MIQEVNKGLEQGWGKVDLSIVEMVRRARGERFLTDSGQSVGVEHCFTLREWRMIEDLVTGHEEVDSGHDGLEHVGIWFD